MITNYAAKEGIMRKCGWVFILISSGLVGSYTHAADDLTVKIKSLLTTYDTTYGGCMANLDEVDAIEQQAGIPNGVNEGQCGRAFVSLDCAGNLIPKASAQAMFSTMQLAYLTQKRVYIVIDKTKKNNGYCVPSRVDIMAD